MMEFSQPPQKSERLQLNTQQKEILIQQSLFTLSEQDWTAFCEALEAPPKDIPMLKKLLEEPSIFGSSDIMV